MGSAQAIVTTVGDSGAIAAVMVSLAPHVRLMVLAAGKDPLRVATGPMVRGERSVIGSLTGTPYEIEKTLKFSVLSDVSPRIETVPLEDAIEAYDRLKSGHTTFRIVLTTGRL